MEVRYLIKIGEIALKGGNRRLFEKQLRLNIERKLKGYKPSVRGAAGRHYLFVENADEKTISTALSRTFGITAFSRVFYCEKDINAVSDSAVEICRDLLKNNSGKKFKINSRRADKSFPLNSYEISCAVGDRLLKEFPELKVKLENPDWAINIEIREKAILYSNEKKGPGGLPVGTAGRGLLLLSGGIDSPAAGYLMAKRGLKIDSIYFHTYPYTSDEAKNKVVSLAEKLTPFTEGKKLFIVPFTELQIKIKEKANPGEITLLSRACMVKISEIIARKNSISCMITGESLSQVASQTVSGMQFTGNATNMIIFRPLAGMDKEEIIKIAKQIDTFETSILPYDDCCTVFAPEHPLINPDLARMNESFENLGIEELLQQTAEKTEIHTCGNR